jgi:hypothetical protein
MKQPTLLTIQGWTKNVFHSETFSAHTRNHMSLNSSVVGLSSSNCLCFMYEAILLFYPRDQSNAMRVNNNSHDSLIMFS